MQANDTSFCYSLQLQSHNYMHGYCQQGALSKFLKFCMIKFQIVKNKTCCYLCTYMKKLVAS